MTAGELHVLLEKRYPPQQGYVLVREVGNGTGSSCRRHADAVALQCWPSRGLGLDGFEVKVSKSDLRRELEDETKAHEVARFCRRWWLVVADEKVVDGLALPDGWGVLLPSGKGLAVHTKPAERTPEAWPTTFVAALVRAAWEQRPDVADRSREIEKAVRDVVASTEKHHEGELARLKADAESAVGKIQAFDEGFGGYRSLFCATKDRAKRLGEAARLGEDLQADRLEKVAQDVEGIAASIRKAIAKRTAPEAP